MDSLLHAHRKILTNPNPTLQSPTSASTPPPPAYTPYDTSADFVFDSEDESTPKTLVTINAPTTIHGSSNIISMPMLDSVRITAVLLSALNARAKADEGAESRRNIHVQLNCGITIVGDRNVVSNVGLRPREAGAAAPATNPTSGAKRKRDAEEESDDVPEAKKVEVAASSA